MTGKRKRGRPKKSPGNAFWSLNCRDIGPTAGPRLNEMAARTRRSKTDIVTAALICYYDTDEMREEMARIRPQWP